MKRVSVLGATGSVGQNTIDLIRETCRDEDIALILVTHATEVSEQFDRVDRLEEINQVQVGSH